MTPAYPLPSPGCSQQEIEVFSSDNQTMRSISFTQIQLAKTQTSKGRWVVVVFPMVVVLAPVEL